MSDNIDDADLPLHESISNKISDMGASVYFGDYNVISPGVHIILEGRQVSHTGG